MIDPREQRSRLFGAFRELFRRLGEAAPLVVVIDDLQWADADSRALLSELMAPPGAPRLLLVATVRTDNTKEESLEISQLGDLMRDAIRLPVERLLPDEARDSPSDWSATARARASWTQSSSRAWPRGIPCSSTHSCVMPAWSTTRRPGHRSRKRCGRASLRCRPMRAACSSSSRSRAVVSRRRLWVLRRDSRSPSSRTTSRCCAPRTSSPPPAADRAITSRRITTEFAARCWLTSMHPRSASHHRRLAERSRATNHIDPEALTVHWREAGELAKAATFAKLAAEKATSALAFDRAAASTRSASRCSAASAPRDATSCGTRRRSRTPDEAAKRGSQYLLAAEGASASESIELRRRAAEQLLRSGRIDEGLAAIEHVCERRRPRADDHAEGRARVAAVPPRARRARGLRVPRARRESTFRKRAQKIDICWSVSAGSRFVDTIRGADFQSRQLLLALRAGEPYRIVRALAMETGLRGIRRRGHAQAHRQAAGEQRPSSRAASIVRTPSGLSVGRGTAAFLQGRWRDGFALNTEAEAILRDHCTGVTWELDTARFMALWSAFYRGDSRASAPRPSAPRRVRGAR